ncbi:hypothetical protein ACXKTX_08055 [Burkholderia gladioli]|uniref:hypothetical protein n=1 Tax=Burkholderia gladioli TaxID=28095 RepID=UPI00163E1A42|nr:hypothetical protein [Burkholderia gladioli]
MTDDIQKRIRQAAKDSRLPNMRDPRHLGYVPPAAGWACARFVGYFELGTHEEEYEGKKRDREKVDLVFELSGPNHEPIKAADGTLIPIRITAQETLDLTYGSSFHELFNAMNYAGSATHMAELVGAAFFVEIFHRRSKDGKRVYATLRSGGYQVQPPVRLDEKSGLLVPVTIESAITAFRMFVWNMVDIGDWHSIYIPGKYPECKDEKTGEVVSPERSKNVIQEKIMSAKNWKTHPLAVAGPGGSPNPPTGAEMQQEVVDMKQLEFTHTHALVRWLAELNAKRRPSDVKPRKRRGKGGQSPAAD